MRILLLHDSLPPLSPLKATTFLTQVVRHAQDAGHDLRELVPHHTDAGKGVDPFRTLMRRRLDIEIIDFDPQVIHVHGLGVLGHLALESGAPYVVSAFAEELSLVQAESTECQHAQEAIENAGCVIVDGDETRRAIEDLFGEVQAVAIAGAGAEAVAERSLQWLWGIYQEVVARRAR